MQFTVYTDLHWGQTSEILKDLVPKKGDIFTGDIFDIKNTSKKHIKEQLQKQQDFIKKCKEVGAYYILGNHDLLPDNTLTVLNLNKIVDGPVPRHMISGDVIFTHGHYIAWDQAQVDEWKAKKPNGVGLFRRLTLEVQDLYVRGTWKPDTIESEKAYNIAIENNCKTIVFGHHHTDKVVDYIYKGIRIINLPRGKTVLDL